MGNAAPALRSADAVKKPNIGFALSQLFIGNYKPTELHTKEIDNLLANEGLEIQKEFYRYVRDNCRFFPTISECRDILTSIKQIDNIGQVRSEATKQAILDINYKGYLNRIERYKRHIVYEGYHYKGKVRGIEWMRRNWQCPGYLVDNMRLIDLKHLLDESLIPCDKFDYTTAVQIGLINPIVPLPKPDLESFKEQDNDTDPDMWSVRVHYKEGGGWV